MLKINQLLKIFYLIALLFVFRQIQLSAAAAAAASTSAVSFLDVEPCQCLVLNCSCCQGVVIEEVALNKKICLIFSLNLFPLKIGIGIKLDNSNIIEFQIDANNPPKYCIPIVLPNSVAMCIKMHDIKLIGLTAAQVCSTIYVTSQTQEVFTQKMPCVQLGATGINLLR